MTTALLGWELGGGLGHVRRLHRLAGALAARGVCPIVVGDVVALAELPYPILPAPVLPPTPRPTPFRARSFADILAVRGFGERAELRALVRGWDGLLAVVRPDVVIAESAPVLTLAATGAWPVVQLGTGVTLPPCELPEYPALRVDAPPVQPESWLLDHVRAVQRERGRPEPATLPAAFAGSRWLAVLPELDPYGDLRNEATAGPLESLPLPASVGVGTFAYLNGDVASSAPALELLTHAGLLHAAFLRGATAESRASLRAAGVPVSDTAPPLDAALMACAIVVHHGGLGVAQAALAAGRPQLIFPEHLEHALTARALAHLGVGRVLEGNFTAEAVVEAARDLGTATWRERAQVVAEGIATRGPLPGVAVLADWVMREGIP